MDTSLGRPGAIVKRIEPKVFIFGGAIVTIAGFFMIHPYMPDLGPLENAMIGSIPIGNVQLPYRYVLVFATIVIGYGYYRLQISKDAKPR
jgi:hypothetical protein